MQQKGLIVEINSNLYKVQVENIIYECICMGNMKKEKIQPTVGDNVVLENVEQENKKVITQILPRKVYIKRPKIANITQIIYVISAISEEENLINLDKQLAYCEFLGIKPIIVINKIDLTEENTSQKEKYKQLENLYKEIGYEVLTTSALKTTGIEDLKDTLYNNITVFAGKSGVGKSSLTNCIMKKQVSKVDEISNKTKTGKQTTTTSKIYQIEKDTYIIDTPGFSTFEIFEIEAKDLAKYFKEFKSYLNTCKYVDCTHIKDEQCAIYKAVNEEEISNQRYENYCKIYKELKDREAHKW